MTIKKQIKILLAEEELTLKDLAEKLSAKSGKKVTADSLSKKLRNNTIKYAEAEELIDCLGYKIKIEKKSPGLFNVIVSVKEKRTSEPLKDVRISLISSDIELESYLAQKGRVAFEQVAVGKYTVELEEIDKKLASIILDIRV